MIKKRSNPFNVGVVIKFLLVNITYLISVAMSQKHQMYVRKARGTDVRSYTLEVIMVIELIIVVVMVIAVGLVPLLTIIHFYLITVLYRLVLLD